MNIHVFYTRVHVSLLSSFQSCLDFLKVLIKLKVYESEIAPSTKLKVHSVLNNESASFYFLPKLHVHFF